MGAGALLTRAAPKCLAAIGRNSALDAFGLGCLPTDRAALGLWRCLRRRYRHTRLLPTLKRQLEAGLGAGLLSGCARTLAAPALGRDRFARPRRRAQTLPQGGHEV